MTSPYWLMAAAFVWGLAAASLSLLPRPPREDWLTRVRLSRWVRYPVLIFLPLMGLYATVELIVSVLIGELLSWDVAMYLQMLGWAILLAIAFRATDLIATQDGLYYGPSFIPWRDVMHVNFKNDALWIHLRRRYMWGAKKIALALFYEASESTAERLLSLRNAHVREQASRGAA